MPRSCAFVCQSLLLAGTILVLAAGAWAQPPISIVGCQKITKAGLYNLNPPSPPTLNAGPGDCLIIAASNVVLDLNGSIITGGGSGAGVHVMSSGANAFIEGRFATLSGFTEGIEIDAAKTTAENFTATANSDAGVLLSNAKQAKLSNFSADANGNDGVRVFKGSYNAIVGSVTATDNGRYGVWLFSTSHDNVGNFFVTNDAIAGIYLGCSGSGPRNSSCKPASNYNSIFSGWAGPASGGVEAYSIAIDLGNGNNRVTNLSIASPTPPPGYDLFDENAACGTNDWFG